MNKYSKNIVIVDDNRMKRQFLGEILKSHFSVYAFSSSHEALPELPQIMPQCILLDMERPNENAFDDMVQIKNNPQIANIPVIFITPFLDNNLERKALESGAVDFVGNNYSKEIICARVLHHAELYTYRCHLEERVKEDTKTIFELQDAIMLALSDLVECRDTTTAGHAQRTREYVRCLIKQLVSDNKYTKELTDDYIRELIRAAPLHDIGKVGVKDAILNKPGGLTNEEFEEMKRHTIFGATAITRAMKAVHNSSFLCILRDISLSHHENWDGTGYPLGLSGEHIPLCGRIMAIADVYDALVSSRPYKDPIPHEKAVKIIHDGIGTFFDPAIVESFLACAEEFNKISQSVTANSIR